MITRPTIHSRIRLNGASATVVKLHDWGALVETNAAATGYFRAGWNEMLPVAGLNGTLGYTGEVCDYCGGVRMVRTGSCSTCLDCGTAGGCG